eukprot:scaffold276_cov116-Isochrysis_galbana.AAC.4
MPWAHRHSDCGHCRLISGGRLLSLSSDGRFLSLSSDGRLGSGGRLCSRPRCGSRPLRLRGSCCHRSAVTVTLSTIRMMVPAVRRRCKGSSNYARSAGWCKLKRTLQLEPRTVLSGRR